MDKQSYPSMPSSLAAWYWMGISIRAARAKAVSFSESDTSLDIIAVKLTNYKQRRHILKVNACWIIFNLYGTIQRTYMAFKANRVLVLQYLKIIKFTCRDLVIKVPHVVPRSITNSNKNNWEWIWTGS